MGWLADLLKEIPTAAKYRYDLERIIESEQKLREKNKELRSEIGELQQEIEKLKLTAPSKLKDDELLALKAIAFSPSCPSASNLTTKLNLNPVHIDYLIGNLLEYNYIDEYPRPVFYDSVETIDVYSVTQSGRRYLYENEEM